MNFDVFHEKTMNFDFIWIVLHSYSEVAADRPVGAFSKSSRPYRSRVSVCPTVDILSRGRGGIWLELCATPPGPGIAAVAPTATSRQVFCGPVV